MTRWRRDRVARERPVSASCLTFALADWSGLLFLCAFTGIGSYLAVRRPANSVGPFLMLIGWGLALGSVHVTASVDALLAGSLEGVAAFTRGPMAGAGRRCSSGASASHRSSRTDACRPTGRPGPLSGPSRACAVMLAFRDARDQRDARRYRDRRRCPEPGGAAARRRVLGSRPVAWQLFPVMFVLVVGGRCRRADPSRYRRSVDLERLQYRWLVGSLAFVAIATVIWAILRPSFDADWRPRLAAARDRLPEQCRSRSSWPSCDIGCTTSTGSSVGRSPMRGECVLMAIFGGAVLLLSSALASVARAIHRRGGVDPHRLRGVPACPRRVRRVVDRRFDRPAYDGRADRDHLRRPGTRRDRRRSSRARPHGHDAGRGRADAPRLWLRPHDVRR